MCGVLRPQCCCHVWGAGQDGQARLEVGGPSFSRCRAGKWQRVGGVKDDPQVLTQVGYLLYSGQFWEG